MVNRNEGSGRDDFVLYSAIISFLIVYLSVLYFGDWQKPKFDDEMLGEAVRSEVILMQKQLVGD